MAVSATADGKQQHDPAQTSRSTQNPRQMHMTKRLRSLTAIKPSWSLLCPTAHWPGGGLPVANATFCSMHEAIVVALTFEKQAVRAQILPRRLEEPRCRRRVSARKPRNK